jgi:hypothetical protein
MLWRLVKRMVRPIWQPVIDSTIYHTRVELKVQRVEGGEKTPAPRYPSEQKPFEEAQRNEGARKVGLLGAVGAIFKPPEC